MKSPLVLALLFLLVSIGYSQKSDLSVELKNIEINHYEMTYNQTSDSTILVNVTNVIGEPVKTLNKDNFVVLEGGWEADIIRAVPLSQAVGTKIKVVLCLDNSASMEQHSEKLLEILDNLIGSFAPTTSVDIVTFDESISTFRYKYDNEYLKIRLQSFDKIDDDIRSYYQSKYQSTGLTFRTYLYDQIFASFIQKENSDIEHENLFFIILSDGRDIGSDFGAAEAREAYKKGIVYSIDFDQSRADDIFLRNLAENSGGKYYKAKDAIELKNYFEEIGLRIIFSGYEVVFRSNIPPQLLLEGVSDAKSNQLINFDRIKIEEINTREIFPLLNYVFFNKNSYDLLQKYTFMEEESIDKFSELNLQPKQLEIYNNILNIIGSRLKRNPASTIRLVGCNDNSGDENNNLFLSESRARVVKAYLKNVWSIDPDRISIEARNLPAKFSNIKTGYGMEENRRVEIYSDDPAILDIVEVRTVSKITRPEVIQLHYLNKSPVKIKSWNLKTTQNDKIIFERTESGNLPENISWNIAPDLIGKSIDNSDFIISLTALNERNIKSNPLVKRVSVDYLSQEMKKRDTLEDRIIEKLSLVLFEFNSSQLDTRNQTVLNRVSESVKEKSVVNVEGYTDDSGAEELNQRLSEERAKATLRAFVSTG